MFPFGAIWGGRVLEHKPSFCVSCHEMKPAYDGWIQSGASKNHPDCIGCHSETGFWGAIDSEFRGLRFLQVHFSGKRTENQPFIVQMPDRYCLQCHAEKKVIEVHKMFVTVGRTCADCHKHKTGFKFSGEIRP